MRNTWQSRASRSSQGPGSSTCGYAFAELMAAMALLSILILIAMPRLVLPDALNVSVFARQVAIDMRLTQQLAIARRVDHTLEFSPLLEPYTSYTIRNESTGVGEPDFPKTFPGGVIVTAGARRSFTFRPGGMGPYIGILGLTGAVLLTVGTDVAVVTVFWYNGRVQVTGP